MAYFAPQVTAAGLSVPSYVDIRESLTSTYRSIYGQSTYLGNDQPDYQFISAISLKLADNASLCQLDYNSRSPLTAIGAALDAVVKINGLVRKSASSSSVLLTISGAAGTAIYSGIVADVNGVYWEMPSLVTIGVAGSVVVNAVCQQVGPVSANPNTVTNPVGGFTAGWVSVNNLFSAVLGTPIETDSNLRARQSVSVAIPSSTRLAGTIAGIGAVPGVTRFNVLENQSNVTDVYGNTGHSMTAVVEGGADLDIATAIYDNRGIGCNTQAATATAIVVTAVTDVNSGNITNIGFVRSVSIPVFVSISIQGIPHPPAPTTATQDAIIAALISYLNSLQIGEEVTQSALYGAALSVMPNLSLPYFSIRAMGLGRTSTTATTDLILQFFEVASGNAANVALTVLP